MPFYIDADKISIKELQKRILNTDLVPSRTALRDNIDIAFSKLEKAGIATFADLRNEIKNTKNIPAFSERTGIDSQYLVLLRRETEGYFPKTAPIRSFDWINKKDIGRLEAEGLKNTLLLYNALHSPQQRKKIIDVLQISSTTVDSLQSLVELTRIQWVSPLTARMLVAAGYPDPKKVANADAAALCSDLERVNKEKKYFKGKIGLRDIRRLITAASYVPM